MILKDKGYFNLAKKLIDGARKEILISQFKIDSCGVAGKSLVNQLLVTHTSKAEKGIKVKVLLDCILPLRGRSANNAFIAAWLRKRKVEVKYLARNRCQHSKILEVDGEHVVIGSHNWTVNSLSRNSEISIYLTDEETIRDIKMLYEHEYGSGISYEAGAIGAVGARQ